jgi:Ni/Co efflux regulator RcnB
MRKAERQYQQAIRKAERRYRAPAYQRPAGYYYQAWRPGHTLPAAYRAPQYRVDYRYYRLPPPPPGYYYTRVDNDVMLTGATTGLIASVIAGLFQ